MKKYFYNSIIFRLAAPPLFGILIYLIILMFFDSVDMLAENFFSNEVIFITGISYVFFEANRSVIVLLNIIYPFTRDLRLRILLQYIFSVLITILIISSLLYTYFIYIEGFSTIETELITFNSVFLFVGVFYHLFFFSFVFLNKKNESKVNREKALRENLEVELQSFKNQVNPDLLFLLLEIVICEIHKDKKSADNLVDNLSKIYRYLLDNKQNELVALIDELNSLKPIHKIFMAKYGDSFLLNVKVDKRTMNFYLIPGTLQLLLELAISENIISDHIPLIFKINKVNESLMVSYELNEKINVKNTVKNRADFLFKAYANYTDKECLIKSENRERFIEIPLITVEEE